MCGYDLIVLVRSFKLRPMPGKLRGDGSGEEVPG